MIRNETKIQLDEYYQILQKQIGDEKLQIEKRLDNLGIFIDISLDLRKQDGLERAIVEGKRLESLNILSPPKKSILFFYLANAYSYNRSLITPLSYIWNDDNFKNEISYSRRALYSDGFQFLPKEIQCRILVNLGNAFSTCGRCIESLEHYNLALEKDPSHSMGRGNKGIALFHYAKFLSDRGHIAHFAKDAYSNLKLSLENPDDPYALKQFQKYIKKLETYYPDSFFKTENSFKEYPLGKTKGEKQYRAWVLAKKLFLHPLNDLGAYSVAARDFLSVPSIVVKIEDPPVYQGFYNQLKQEYVSARFLYYEGVTSSKSHFSDKDVLLYNTLDYPEYSLQIEKIKMSYRVIYSLFDKIAFFINDYFHLGEKEKNVYFKTIWYSDPKKKLEVRPKLIESENGALIALFWVSKDLFDEEASYNEYLEPEAQQLYIIRNHLEHKYTKIHYPMWSGKPSDDSMISNLFYDDLAYSMYRSDFERKTLKLLKLARAALMYLVFAMKVEEGRREKLRDPSEIILPAPPLPLYRE